MKNNKLLSKCIFLVFSAIIVLIFAALLIAQNMCQYIGKIHELPNLILICPLIVIIAVWTILLRRNKIINLQGGFFGRHSMIIISVMTVLLFIIQIWIMNHIYFETGWDVAIIVGKAQELAKGVGGQNISSGYLSRYPNNCLLLLIFTGICIINNTLNIVSNYFMIAIIGALLVDIAGILLFKIIKEKLGVGAGYIGFVLYILLIGLSPWIMVPYSDTYGIIFPMIVLYLYFKKDKKVYHPALIVLWSIVGYWIKPTTAICLLAIIILEIIKIIEKQGKIRDTIKGWKREIRKIGISVIITIVAVVLAVGAKTTAINYAGFDIDKESTFTMTHFFMMGQNNYKNGGYYGNDVKKSGAFSTVKDRQKYNIKKGLDRIAKRKVLGNIKFYTKKTLTDYNNGSFAWGYEGGFYTKVRENDNSTAGSLLRSYYYGGGENNHLFMSLQQILWLLVLIGVLFTVLKINHSRTTQVLMIIFIGFYIYLMLFEARARYVYVAVPVFIILAMTGFKNYRDLITKK